MVMTIYLILQKLVEVGEELGVGVELVHRKINLQAERQPWEHHKYSIRKLPAATLSALPVSCTTLSRVTLYCLPHNTYVCETLTQIVCLRERLYCVN